MSAKRRRLQPEARRVELLHAMIDVLREQGVAHTTVSDIVKRAGVAQGTFYLYFESKEQALCALAEHMIEDLIEDVRVAVEIPNATALEKLLAVRDALVEMSDEPHEVELGQIFHAPENRDIHDRVTAGVGPSLHPLIQRIVEQGVAEGVFSVGDPRLAAWFAIGSFFAYELSLESPEAVHRAMNMYMTFVLRGLGYTGDALSDSA